MKKGIITFLIFLLFMGGLIYIASNKKLSNQIIITSQDISESLFNTEEEVNIKDLKVNSLQTVTSTFYYDELTQEQKNIYLSLEKAIKNLDKKAKVKDYNYIDEKTTMEDVKIAVQNLFLDHPEIFYVDNNYSVSTIDLLNSKRVEIELNYLVSDKADLDSKIEKINSVLNPIVEKASSMDKFNAELYIHDKICELSSYYRYSNINDVPQECHSIYGTFILNKAVCDGLSKAYQLALNKLGIENILLTGYIQDQAHAWNLVKIDNNWYHVDITSDKSVSDKEGKEATIHSYFNITTEQIKKTNVIDNEKNIPIANSTDYNYYIKMGKYIDVTDNFSAKLKNILKNNDNQYLVEFATDSRMNSVPEKMVYIFTENQYSNYTNKNSNKFNYYNILNTYIIFKNNKEEVNGYITRYMG